MKRYFTFALIFSVIFLGFGQEKPNISIHKGNQSFDNQDFDDASTHYLYSIEQSENNFKAHYNLANSIYKKEYYSDAISQYERTLNYAQTDEEKQKTLYNLGNAHLQNNNTEKAIKNYKKALQHSPNNPTILKNLRIALKKQKEEENQKNRKQNKNENNQNQQNNNQNQQENNQQNNPNQQNENNQNQQNNNQNQQGNNQQNNPNQQNGNNQNQQNNNPNQQGNNQQRNSPIDHYAPQNNQLEEQRKEQQRREELRKERENQLLKYIGEREKHTTKKIFEEKVKDYYIEDSVHKINDESYEVRGKAVEISDDTSRRNAKDW